ncbi:MAG TPA: hypothetical protein ACFYD6_12370 [Candidatus Brocadiia bacterium]|nr:hypothetical protein [Candidatus Brocadiales bacterium]
MKPDKVLQKIVLQIGLSEVKPNNLIWHDKETMQYRSSQAKDAAFFFTVSSRSYEFEA